MGPPRELSLRLGDPLFGNSSVVRWRRPRVRPFPDDLAQAQQEWSATYQQLAEWPGRTELRRRLCQLSAQLLFQPYWQQQRPGPAAWRELRDLGRPDGDVSERLHR